MSKLRSVNTHFWNDNYIVDLDPIEKLLFLYLLTNDQTNMLGIYELPIRRIAFDTGIDKDMLIKIFGRFEDSGKAKFLDGYVILPNFLKNQNFNKNMEKAALKAWEQLPLNIKSDKFCLPFAKGLQSLSNPLPRVPKPSEPMREREVEREIEMEVEEEVESSDSPFIILDEKKLKEEEVADWYSEKFRILKENFQRQMPVDYKLMIKDFINFRIGDRFEDDDHLKNAIRSNWKNFYDKQKVKAKNEDTSHYQVISSYI